MNYWRSPISHLMFSSRLTSTKMRIRLYRSLLHHKQFLSESFLVPSFSPRIQPLSKSVDEHGVGDENHENRQDNNEDRIHVRTPMSNRLHKRRVWICLVSKPSEYSHVFISDRGQPLRI